MGEQRRGEDEMAALSRAALAVREFAAYMVTSFIFFSYATGVAAFTFTLGVALGLLGVHPYAAGLAGVVAGLAVASALYYKATRRVLAAVGVAAPPGVEARLALVFSAAFALGGLAAWRLPWLSGVAWYPALAAALTLAGAWLGGSGVGAWRAHLAAGLVMLALSPAVILLARMGHPDTFALAFGSMELAYMVAAVWAMGEARRSLGAG